MESPIKSPITSLVVACLVFLEFCGLWFPVVTSGIVHWVVRGDPVTSTKGSPISSTHGISRRVSCGLSGQVSCGHFWLLACGVYCRPLPDCGVPSRVYCRGVSLGSRGWCGAFLFGALPVFCAWFPSGRPLLGPANSDGSGLLLPVTGHPLPCSLHLWPGCLGCGVVFQWSSGLVPLSLPWVSSSSWLRPLRHPVTWRVGMFLSPHCPLLLLWVFVGFI